MREVGTVCELEHPNTIKVYDFGQIEGSGELYIAMELLQGKPLDNVLENERSLAPERVDRILGQVCGSLQEAHDKGIVHRDLKPANLLRTTEHVIKLTDFGIARDTTATALTAAGKTVGTYAYMAPEQIRGKPPVDKKTDLYALGCVLFEMIAGETPFLSENQGEMLMMHLQEEPPRVTSLVPDCPIFVEDLIFHLLEKNPDDRPYDALALQVEIEGILKKIGEQRSIAAETLAGGTAIADGTRGGDELKAALGKTRKKKKKQDSSPFYERTWFLGLCLSVVLAFIVWHILPWGEDKLMAEAERLIKSEFASDQIQARDKYLKLLLERYPQGRHATQATSMIIDVDKKETATQMRARAARRQPPANEAERQFLNAEKFLQFGDQVTALRKFGAILDLFKTKDEYRIYVLLCQDEIDKILAQSGGESLAAFLNKRLKDADAARQSGKVGEAESIWTSIKTLYEDNAEATVHVAYAKKKLRGDDPGPPPWIEEKKVEPNNEAPGGGSAN
jgi:serine/threonine-protein kinase